MAAVSGAVGSVSRAIVELRGQVVRSLVSYLLLVAAVALLLHDTGAITSPYLFIWPLVAAFAGLFGAWSSVPVFLIACGYFGVLFMEDKIDPDQLAPTILITAIPIIFSVIVWSHVRRFSDYKRDTKHLRNPTDYKIRTTEITNLITESEMILNAIGDGVLAVDSQGIIQLINPAAQNLLGWSKQDALTLQYESVLKLTTEQGEKLADASDPIKLTLNTNQESRSKALQLETKTGKKLYVSLVASPLGESGSGIIIILRDITKERAEEHQQAEFISTASHEMRTPVASIEGYLGLALNPSTATIDDKAREYIKKAQDSATHLGSLFQDLLDVSKAEDGRLSNNPKVIDVVAFAGDIVEGLQQKASDKGLQLLFKPAPKGGEKGERNLTPIYYGKFDRDHIRELIANLTENAIKYTPKGVVSVDVTGDAEHITISVADSGIGIPAEDIPHLFQKFYRVDNSDTREIGGTGLGLYLCRRLVETLGGRIWVESTYKQGSTFFVELPRLGTSEAQLLLDEQNRAAKVDTKATPNHTPAAGSPSPAPQSPRTTPAPPRTQPQPQPQPPQTAPPLSTSAPATSPQPQTAAAESVVTPRPSPQPRVPSSPQQSTPVSIPVRTNTPLSHIEQNPAAFTAARNASAQSAQGTYERPK